MKSMKCSDLGGPDSCTQTFEAETWKEIVEKREKDFESLPKHKLLVNKFIVK